MTAPRPAARVVSEGLILLAMLLANYSTPLWADDYCRTRDIGVLGSFAEAWHEYFSWTGRFFPSAFTYLALSERWPYHILVFDMINAIAFVALVDIIVRLAEEAIGSSEYRSRGFLDRTSDYIAVALMLWWLPRTIAEVALWKTGSIGYLWAVTGELGVLLAAWRFSRGGIRGLEWPKALAAAGFAFVFSTFLEPLTLLTALGLCTLALRTLLLNRREFGRVLLMTLSHMAGTVLLFAAPGNYARLSALPPMTVADQLNGWLGFVGEVFNIYWPAAVVLIVAAYAVPGGFADGGRPSGVSGPRVGSPSDARACAPPHPARRWVFPLMAVFYLATLLGAPRDSWAARVSFPASALLICWLATFWFLRPRSDLRSVVTASLVLVLGALSVVVSARDIRMVGDVSQAWNRSLADQRRSYGPDAEIRLPLVKFNGRTILVRGDTFFEGITKNPDYWINVCYARAMKVRAIRGY